MCVSINNNRHSEVVVCGSYTAGAFIDGPGLMSTGAYQKLKVHTSTS